MRIKSGMFGRVFCAYKVLTNIMVVLISIAWDLVEDKYKRIIKMYEDVLV